MTMATASASASASASLSAATFAATVSSGRSSQRRKTRVNYIGGMNCFSGLKAHNNVASLGLPVCTEQSFAKIVSSLKLPSQGRGGGGGGGALSSTCNAAAEIFKIAAIMNGLVLIGVAVGFVLLRIEASFEESEEKSKTKGSKGDEEEWRSRDEEREQENRGDRETERERRRRSTKMIDQQSRRSVKERRLIDRSKRKP